MFIIAITLSITLLGFSIFLAWLAINKNDTNIRNEAIRRKVLIDSIIEVLEDADECLKMADTRMNILDARVAKFEKKLDNLDKKKKK